MGTGFPGKTAGHTWYDFPSLVRYLHGRYGTSAQAEYYQYKKERIWKSHPAPL